MIFNRKIFLIFICLFLVFVPVTAEDFIRSAPYHFPDDTSGRGVQIGFIGSLLMISDASIPYADGSLQSHYNRNWIIAQEDLRAVQEYANNMHFLDPSVTLFNPELDPNWDLNRDISLNEPLSPLWEDISSPQYQEWALEFRKRQLNTYINNQLFRELLFPSSTAQAVGTFFQNVFGIEKGKGLTYDGTPHLYSLAYPEESRRWYCDHHLDDTNYFIPSSTDFYSGIFSPDVLFIYGLSKDYTNYPDLVDKNGNPLGYLYTFSWYISHPLSQEEFDELSSSEKNQMGLDINTGEIEIAIGVKTSNSQEHFSSSKKLKPGESSSVTVSRYLNIKLETIFFQFRGDYKLNGNQFYPPQKNCGSNNIGCIKSFEEGLENDRNYPTGSYVVITEDEDGNVYAGGIPVGGLPSGSSSNNNNDGGIFGDIWG